MRGRVAGLVFVVALAAITWWLWPAGTTSKAVAAAADGGASIGSSESLPAPTDPTATGAIEITAAGAAMLAVRSKTYRRAFAGEHQIVRELPLGEYEVFASGTDGTSAYATVTVSAGVTAPVVLKLAALPGSVALRGTVRDILGGTVPGAEVWVDLTIVATNGNGEFEAPVLPGERQVRVRAGGYADTQMKVWLREERRIEVVLYPAASLHGVVAHADGSVAAGARVFARELERPAGDEVETFADAEGKFEFGGIRAGIFDLQASTANEIGFAERVMVAPASVRDVRIALGAAVSISGRTLAADGLPIAGAKVKVGADPGAPTSVTDREGRFRLSPLLPGPIILDACADEHVCVRLPARFYAASPVEPIDIVLDAASVLRLHIVDRNGAPVSDAVAYLGDSKSCESTPDGECVFDHLRPRRTKVRVNHATAGQLRDEVIDIGPGETRLTLRLVPGGTVRGIVRWDDGKPAQNVQVSSGFRSKSNATTRSGADGRYELVNLGPGYSRIRAVLTEKSELDMTEMYAVEDSGKGPVVSIELRQGETRDGVDLVVRRETKTITGTVVDADGAPVTSAQVGVVRERERLDEEGFEFYATGAKTYSNADGTFAIDSVSEGEFAVWALAEGSARGVVRHARAPARDVTVKLPRGASIDGTVKDERGAPVTAFVVRGPSYQRVRDAAGHFRLDGISAGEHKVAIYGASDGAEGVASATVQVKSGEATQVSIVLKRTMSVTGRLVTWPEGTPIANVELVGWADGSRRATPTTRDGRFRIDGLVPGTARISGWDLLGDGDAWKRTVGSGAVVDLGDFAVYAKRGDRTPWLSLEENDRVLAVDGRDVTTLGERSLAGVLAEARPGTQVHLKKANGETKTLSKP